MISYQYIFVMLLDNITNILICFENFYFCPRLIIDQQLWDSMNFFILFPNQLGYTLICFYLFQTISYNKHLINRTAWCTKFHHCGVPGKDRTTLGLSYAILSCILQETAFVTRTHDFKVTWHQLLVLSLISI